MSDGYCDRCCLGLDPCFARASGAPRLCTLARRERAEVEAGRTPGTTYRALIEGRSAAPPPLAGRVASLVRSAARHVAAGMPRASVEVVAARLDTCRRCPRHRPDSGTCGVCGCNLRRKASWELEECPEGRWPKPT